MDRRRCASSSSSTTVSSGASGGGGVGVGGATNASSQPGAAVAASEAAAATEAAAAAAAVAAAERETASLKASWALYYTHENTYLNWVRNGLTATAVGMGFVMFRVARDSATFSLGGVCVQAMGVVYITLGVAQYLVSAFRLRRELRITPAGADVSYELVSFFFTHGLKGTYVL